MFHEGNWPFEYVEYFIPDIPKKNPILILHIYVYLLASKQMIKILKGVVILFWK